MKFIGLVAGLSILLTCCEKEINTPEISNDFEGKFVLNASKYLKRRSAYTLDQFGLTQLPVFDTASVYNYNFTWIRNGQFITYREQRSHGYSINTSSFLVIHPDGTLERDFYNDFGCPNAIGEISPTGNHLAIAQFDLFWYNLQGVKIYALDQAFNPTLMDSLVESAGEITWSPDGGRFIFGKYGVTTGYAYGIYNMSTQSVIPIFEFSDPSQRPYSVAWSADGNHLSFIQDSILYIGDANGKSIYPVSIETQKVVDAAWSTSTVELAYVRISPDKLSSEIVIYDPSSETRTSLYIPEERGSPVEQLKWSKDGSSIAFVGVYGGLFVMRQDGTDVRQIFDRNVESFDWHED